MNNIAQVESHTVFKGKFRPFLLKETKFSDVTSKKAPFLSHLPQDALNVLMEKAKTITYPKRAMIVTEGDNTSSFFIILSGKVKVFSTDIKSKE
jgi:CRP-like cAMP-binding protein